MCGAGGGGGGVGVANMSRDLDKARGHWLWRPVSAHVTQTPEDADDVMQAVPRPEARRDFRDKEADQQRSRSPKRQSTERQSTEAVNSPDNSWLRGGHCNSLRAVHTQIKRPTETALTRAVGESLDIWDTKKWLSDHSCFLSFLQVFNSFQCHLIHPTRANSFRRAHKKQI